MSSQHARSERGAPSRWGARLLALGLLTVALPPSAQAAPPAARMTLAAAHDAVARDIWAGSELAQLQQKVSRRLSELNGKLQSRAYFDRVPAGAQLVELERSLRLLATKNAIELTKVEAVPDAAKQACQRRIRFDQRWKPTDDQLFGKVDLRLHFRGSEDFVARFVDALPGHVGRLVLISGREHGAGGELVLLGEAWFERECKTPEVDFQWPSLRERLLAGGWQPGPELDKALASEEGRRTQSLIDDQKRAVEATKRVVLIAVDFPRWLGRWRLIQSRGEAVVATSGRAILGLH